MERAAPYGPSGRINIVNIQIRNEEVGLVGPGALLYVAWLRLT